MPSVLKHVSEKIFEEYAAKMIPNLEVILPKMDVLKKKRCSDLMILYSAPIVPRLNQEGGIFS